MTAADCGVSWIAMAFYRDIEYRILMRPGREAWAWTIHPAGANPIAGAIDGPRERAVTAAMNAITRVLKKAEPAKTP